MTPYNYFEKNEPLLDKFIKFAKDNPALTLGSWTIASAVLTLLINTCAYIYRAGFYCTVFHIPNEFLGPVHTSGLPVSVVCGAAIATFLFVYSLLPLTAYIECRLFKFFLVQLGVFAALIFGGLCVIYPEFLSAIFHLNFSTVLSTVALIILTDLVLNSLSICYILNLSEQNKLIRITNQLIFDRHKLERCDHANFMKTRRVRFWNAQINCHTNKEKKLSDSIEKNQTKTANQTRPSILIQQAIICILICFAVLFILFGLMGTVHATQTTDFRLIDTDQDIFSQQIIAELNTDTHEVVDNDKVNGLVELFRNEEHIVIAPCVYSENKDEITIYTAYQHMMPVENSTFVRKSFHHLDIQ